MRRAIAVATIGTVVEYYDFLIYAQLATILSGVFFPGADPLAALMLTFGAFATSYVVRPLGAMIFGSLGDRLGSRRSLVWVILLMTASTGFIGLLPSYDQIGVLAPILLTLARLLQGISMGGELGGASAFVAEYAPVHQRGRYLGLLGTGVGLGMLLGAVVTVAATRPLSQEALQSWGWRIPFLFAIPLGLVGLYMRSRLDDTPRFTSMVTAREVVTKPLTALLRNDYTRIGLAMAVASMSPAAAYLYLVYMPSHLIRIVGFAPNTALVLNMIGMVVMCVAVPLFGTLSDRIGRAPVLGLASAVALVATYPAFTVLDRDNLGLTALVLVLFALINSAALAGALPVITGMFQADRRNTGSDSL